jgi:hypothetical protein
VSTDLDAAVTRLTRTPRPEDGGINIVSSDDLRLLLADWERRGEELARIQRLPTLDWAQVTASITQRLATISRAGDTEAAKTMLAVLDKGKTYVSRLEAERDAARAEVERLRAELTSARGSLREYMVAHEQSEADLARLRERDARVRAVLGNPAIDRQTAITRALELLKETS